MMNRTLATLLSAALAVGTPSVVFGQDEETGEVDTEFKDVTAQASEAYSAGEYDRAIALFEQAYEIKPVSNILYNIARIHEEAGQIDEAIEYYDAFVVAPNVEQTARKDALDRLKTLREVKALKEGEGEASTTRTTESEPEPEPAPEPAEPEPEPEPTKSTGRTVGWVFLGVGGASLIGAGVFGLLAQSKFDDFESATSLQDRRAAASAGRTNAVVADSLLVAGAVTAVVGGVFLIVASSGGETDTRASNTWTVSPLVGGDALGLGLGLDF